jgi:hypothetical protein
MEADMNIAETGLPELRELAGALMGAEAPDPLLLDQIASLAATVATHRREEVRQELLAGITERVGAILPTAGEDLQSHLGNSSSDELASLGALLDAAEKARAAFDRADSDITAAHGRGDYAAMAPLALEADAQKAALAAASADVASRIGRGTSTPEAPAVEAAEEPISAPEPETETNWPVAGAADKTETEFERVAEADLFPIAPPLGEPASSPVAAALVAAGTAEPQSERRRLRGLIRQMRATMDDV